MPSNKHGMSTAFCALAVSSQSGTTPSTWRMESRIVNEVSINDSMQSTMNKTCLLISAINNESEWKAAVGGLKDVKDVVNVMWLLKKRLLQFVRDWVPRL